MTPSLLWTSGGLDPRYPGPQPGDPPGWDWHPMAGYDTAKPCVALPCAWCGRMLGRRATSVFFNLNAPLGRMEIVGWHDRCVPRDPAYRGNWTDRQDREVWRTCLETVRARGESRIGPGDRYPRPSEVSQLSTHRET